MYKKGILFQQKSQFLKKNKSYIKIDSVISKKIQKEVWKQTKKGPVPNHY